MGRKKKLTVPIVSEPTAEEKQIPEKVSASLDNIGYNGNVTVTVTRGSKKIKTIQYHNSGALNLFKFLGICFTGNYANAEEFRPTKIKLFYNPNQISSRIVTPMPDNIEEASDFISIDEAVYTQDTSDEEGSKWSSTCHFRIPYAWLKTNQVNQVCLYGKSITENTAYSAIYFFIKEETVGIEEWDPIDTTLVGNNNYNLIIDWTLTITNK